MRRGMTLIEILVVMMILVIVGAIAMSAIGNLGEAARADRTKTIIKRCDAALAERWHSYRHRALPLMLGNPNYTTRNIACIRARAIRDLMRVELPERATDIDWRICEVRPVNLTEDLKGRDLNPLPAMSLGVSPVYHRYQRIVEAAPATWADTNASSECLYMILGGIRQGETNGLDFLSASEVGDTDGDGMKEVLDGWGRPLYFWRWAPGYASPLHTRGSMDPYDPHNADPQYDDPDPATHPFALHPLIVSAGPDGVLDLQTDKDRRYASLTDSLGGANKFYPVNPFPLLQEASPFDFAGNGLEHYDNLSNHDQQH